MSDYIVRSTEDETRLKDYRRDSCAVIKLMSQQSDKNKSTSLIIVRREKQRISSFSQLITIFVCFPARRIKMTDIVNQSLLA